MNKHIFAVTVQAELEEKILKNFIENNGLVYYGLENNGKFITYFYSIPIPSFSERKIQYYLKLDTNFTVFPIIFTLKKEKMEKYKIKKKINMFLVENKINIEDIEIVYSIYKNKLNNFFFPIDSFLNSEIEFIIIKYGLKEKNDFFIILKIKNVK